ncbi:MAG: TRAP transporter large permease subunit [Rhodospirillales bacterium]|nr:TRAP transporter large permease subunit [Rhodospirillales bacterium]
MENYEIGLWAFGLVLVLIALRLPIGVALGLVSIGGVTLIKGTNVTFALLESIPFEFAAHWTLSAIPMFLLMGSIAHHSGIAEALYVAARVWLGRAPGGLAVATNFGCAAFAAASGSSTATSAALGRLAIPEMNKAGYDKGLSTAVVASAGTLGGMIPPSIGMLIYGLFAEVSIAKLFIAGILPGLLSAAIYAGMIMARCVINPSLAPKIEMKVTWGMRFGALRDVWPLIMLIIGILGGLYSGLFSPTEAGACGAFFSMVIAALQGRLNWKMFKASVTEALSATARIFFVAVGAVLLTKFLAMAGTPFFLAEMFKKIAADPVYLVAGSSLIFIFLGMFLDPLGIKLLTLPILIPMFEALGLDLIWFGILVIKYVEIGLITPPVGFNVYVIKSVVGDSVPLETIFKGVTWFLGCEVIILALLVGFPQISLYLPSLID